MTTLQSNLQHVGAPLDGRLGEKLRTLTTSCPRYRWLRALSHLQAVEDLQQDHALVHPSKLEGGANVVIEAIGAAVPVLAGQIDFKVGLLGSGCDGYFPLGSDAHLAALMRRFASDATLAEYLRRHCQQLRFRSAPERESCLLGGLIEVLLQR